MPLGGAVSISVENVTENPKDELPFLEEIMFSFDKRYWIRYPAKPVAKNI